MNSQKVRNSLPLPFIPSRRGRGKWTFYVAVIIDELVK
jgi:hypothetical protein